MRNLFMLAAIAVAMLAAGPSLATIGWAGNAWPNAGSPQVPTGPFSVYVQVWKGGVTDSPGQGANIAVQMNITNNISGSASVAMTYLGDVGNNDEYTAQVGQALLLGASTVTVDFVVTDLTDNTTYAPVRDQANNPAPLTYPVTNVLPNDVEAYFVVCMSGEPTSGPPCLIGSVPALGSWVTGVPMIQVGPELYYASVVFPAGSNPYFEYKYQKDGCSSWESGPNRSFTLPTIGTTVLSLPQDSWNNLPMGCNSGEVLTGDKEVCFQVCVDAVGTTGGVCVIGNIGDLTNWTTGVPMTEISAGLYQACLVFAAGRAMPINVEYKFKKDGCSTWESVPNRAFTVDNALAASTTFTSNWDDGSGACAPVGTTAQSWGALKSLFR